MNEADRTRLAVSVGITAYGVVYLCAAFLEWPLLTYYPERGAWRFVEHAPATAIGYFGLVFWGALAGIDAGVVTWLATGMVSKKPLSPRMAALTPGWALVALVLAATFFTFKALT